MNNHKPHKGNWRHTGTKPWAVSDSTALLDAFAHMMTSTVRQAVLDWLEAHRVELLEAVRGSSPFEIGNRPLPYHRFSLRLSKALRSINAMTFGDIVTVGKDELLNVKGLGVTCVCELEGILREYGVPADKWAYPH